MFWASCFMTGICGARHYRVQDLVMNLCIYRERCNIQQWMIWKTPLTSKWVRSPVNFTITYAKSSKSPCISPIGKQMVWQWVASVRQLWYWHNEFTPAPRVSWFWMDIADGTYAISQPSNISALVTQVHLLCTFLKPQSTYCVTVQCPQYFIVFHNFYMERGKQQAYNSVNNKRKNVHM
jgi:hypothetical protein